MPSNLKSQAAMAPARISRLKKLMMLKSSNCQTAPSTRPMVRSAILSNIGRANQSPITAVIKASAVPVLCK
ncbi:hypothetical protein ASG14_19645 [Pedobacter sp. Leaf194]|nr:hypothetical protein ASG14_19645 [Pedobacter sp. Leaf194]